MDRFDSIRRIGATEATAAIAGGSGERSLELFRHGTLQVKVYSPVDSDPQSPHSRDEVYVVIRGTGTFVSDEGRQRFAPGEFLFCSGRSCTPLRRL